MDAQALQERLPGRVVEKQPFANGPHFCRLCALPIRVYARFLPCLHVLCAQCAQQGAKQSAAAAARGGAAATLARSAAYVLLFVSSSSSSSFRAL